MQQMVSPEGATSAVAGRSQTFSLIVFPEGVEDAVVAILDEVGVPGFTQSQKVTGRGSRGRHFDNPIWPGADGAIFTVTPPAQAAALSQALVDFSHGIDRESHGLYGIHVFSWPCSVVS